MGPNIIFILLASDFSSHTHKHAIKLFHYSDTVLCRVSKWWVYLHLICLYVRVLLKPVHQVRSIRRDAPGQNPWNFKTHLLLRRERRWFAPMKLQLYITAKKYSLHFAVPPELKLHDEWRGNQINFPMQRDTAALETAREEEMFHSDAKVASRYRRHRYRVCDSKDNNRSATIHFFKWSLISWAWIDLQNLIILRGIWRCERREV